MRLNIADAPKECTCKNCKHRKPCKVLIEKRWVRFDICTALLDGSEHEYALVVTDYDMCEMYTERKECIEE